MFSRCLAFTAFALSVIPVSAIAADEIVVYSARKEHLIKPLFDQYTNETGVKIQYITGKAGVLLERLKAEGKNTNADMFITTDAGNLWQARQSGVLQSVESEILNANVPVNLRDPDNQWFGLSIRARIMVYNSNTTSPEKLSSYEALAGSEWDKKLILRTSKKVYNQSLVASLIAEHGVEKTETIVKGWVNNLAMNPTANDTEALKAVAAGIGNVAIVNTYYFGRLMKAQPELPLSIFWPNQGSNGVHINVSGAGITKFSPNKDKAVELLEWLSDKTAQTQFAALNMEYPVHSEIEMDPIVAKWGTFTSNPINIAKYGELQAEAIKLMDRMGYK